MNHSLDFAKETLRRICLERMAAASGPIPLAEPVLNSWICALPPSGFIVSFRPLAGEPDVRPLNRHLADCGRLAWVDWSAPAPVCKLALSAAREPNWSLPLPGSEVPADQIGAILVPGVAFNMAGDRLGRGWGAYDRLLGAYPGTFSIGVAWSSCRFTSIPMAPTDHPVSQMLWVD